MYTKRNGNNLPYQLDLFEQRAELSETNPDIGEGDHPEITAITGGVTVPLTFDEEVAKARQIIDLSARIQKLIELFESQPNDENGKKVINDAIQMLTEEEKNEYLFQTELAEIRANTTDIELRISDIRGLCRKFDRGAGAIFMSNPEELAYLREEEHRENHSFNSTWRHEPYRLRMMQGAEARRVVRRRASGYRPSVN